MNWQISRVGRQSEQGEEKQEAANQAIESNAAAVEEKKILIAYFTWADNTVVEDADAAIQSALSHYESVGDTAEYERGTQLVRQV